MVKLVCSLCIIISQQAKFWDVYYELVTLSIHLTVCTPDHISCKHNFPLIVVVYDLRMCMKGDNSRPNTFKVDNSREIIVCVGLGILFDLTHCSSFLCFPTCLEFYLNFQLVRGHRFCPATRLMCLTIMTTHEVM